MTNEAYCINDKSRRYLGNEPSPKGLGFCAHDESTGVTRKGRDGNMWKVKEDKNGVRRWYKQGESNKSSAKKEGTLKEKFWVHLRGARDAVIALITIRR